MKDLKMDDERIIRIADNLEQIKSVDKMIHLHQNDNDDIMLGQYKYRRDKFVKEIGKLLIELKIEPRELLVA